MKNTLLLLALVLLSPGASASNFYGYKAPLPNVTITAPDNLLGFKVTVTTGGALEAFGANFRAASGNGSMGLYAADGAGGDPGTLVAQTGSFAIDAAGTLQLPPTAPVTLAAGDYWIMGVFSQDAFPGYGFSTTEVIKYRALPFSGTLPGTFGTTATYMGGKFNYYIKVAGSIHAVLYVRNAKVPGAGDDGSGIPKDAVFADLGSPAINRRGDIAFRATWTSPTGPGVGVFLRSFNVGLNDHLELLAKVGGTLGGSPTVDGMLIKKLDPPLLDDQGNLACRLYGESSFGALDAVVAVFHVSPTYLPDQPEVVAQEGKVLPGTGGGVLRSIKSFAMTPDGQVLIEGMLALRRGVVTAKTAQVLCATNSAGGLDVVAREGETKITGTTFPGIGADGFPGIRTFEVFQPVRGWNGVTSTFNDREMVFTVTFQGTLAGTNQLARSKRAAVLVHLP